MRSAYPQHNRVNTQPISGSLTNGANPLLSCRLPGEGDFSAPPTSLTRTSLIIQNHPKPLGNQQGKSVPPTSSTRSC
jgi:hypothetical protein